MDKTPGSKARQIELKTPLTQTKISNRHQKSAEGQISDRSDSKPRSIHISARNPSHQQSSSLLLFGSELIQAGGAPLVSQRQQTSPQPQRLFLQHVLSTEQIEQIQYYKEKKSLFRQIRQHLQSEEAIKGRINSMLQQREKSEAKMKKIDSFKSIISQNQEFRQQIIETRKIVQERKDQEHEQKKKMVELQREFRSSSQMGSISTSSKKNAHDLRVKERENAQLVIQFNAESFLQERQSKSKQIREEIREGSQKRAQTAMSQLQQKKIMFKKDQIGHIVYTLDEQIQKINELELKEKEVMAALNQTKQNEKAKMHNFKRQLSQGVILNTCIQSVKEPSAKISAVQNELIAQKQIYQKLGATKSKKHSEVLDEQEPSRPQPKKPIREVKVVQVQLPIKK